MVRTGVPCPYCGVSQQAFARHLRRRHANEARVRKILKKYKDVETLAVKFAYRRQAFKVLAYEGKAKHNERILARPSSSILELAPARKSRVGVTRFHLQCPNCRSLFWRLGRHKCPVKNQRTVDVGEIHNRARYIAVEKQIRPTVKVSQTLIKSLAQIHDGPIKSAIYGDALLLQWADFEVQKHIPNVDSSSTEDEDETPEVRAARRRRRRRIQKSITYKMRNESRRSMICKQLRLLAQYIIRNKKKYSPDLTLVDTFRKDYIGYTSRAVRRLTCEFMNVEQAKKLCTWLSKCFKLNTITTSGGHLTRCVLSVLLEATHEFAVDNQPATIVSRGALNAQISIITLTNRD